MPDDNSLLLRRPFSIHRVDRRPGWAGTVEVVFDVRGQGTELLARSRQHTTLEVLGPLGRGRSAFPTEPTNCLLVGGGIGAAPLLFLAEELRGHGHRVDYILGGRDAGAHPAADRGQTGVADGDVHHRRRLDRPPRRRDRRARRADP